MSVGTWEAFGLILRRELALSFRRPDQLTQPLVFFLIVTTLFPLGLNVQLSLLRDMAPGVLWVAALLSSLLSLDALFKNDADDGTLEQLALCGQGLTVMVIAKTLAHWLVSGGACGSLSRHDAELGARHPDVELAGIHRRGTDGGPEARQCALVLGGTAAGHAAAHIWRRGNGSRHFGYQPCGRALPVGCAVRADVDAGAVRGHGGTAHHVGMKSMTSTLRAPRWNNERIS